MRFPPLNPARTLSNGCNAMSITLASPAPDGKPPADLDALVRKAFRELPAELAISPELSRFREAEREFRNRQAAETKRMITRQVERFRQSSAAMNRDETEREIGRLLMKEVRRQVRREVRRLMRDKID